MFPLIPPRPPLATITVSRCYKGLSSSTPRLFQITSSCQQVHREPGCGGCVREIEMYTAQMLQLTAFKALLQWHHYLIQIQ